MGNLKRTIKQEAALQKLKVKQHVDLCRRRVAYYEWKQSMLQMTMDDFKFFLKRIEKCSVRCCKWWMHMSALHRLK